MRTRVEWDGNGNKERARICCNGSRTVKDTIEAGSAFWSDRYLMYRIGLLELFSCLDINKFMQPIHQKKNLSIEHFTLYIVDVLRLRYRLEDDTEV